MIKIGEKINQHSKVLGVILTTILFIGLAYMVYSYRSLEKELRVREVELQGVYEDKADLLVSLRESERIISQFQGEIRSIGNTVGDLKKLSETDEELLKKYSKVSFLNENYVPSRLVEVPDKYVLQPERTLHVHRDAWPFLQNLLDSASRDEEKLLIASAYRSFGTQAVLKQGYTVSYGSGANTFSADQGYSEHQLGTTVDFTTLETGANFSQFKNTSAYEWLTKNAYKYGFILSYPEGNKYYKNEPWHWRFVGTTLARFLYNEKLNFYDVSQREIDKYLIKIFDE